MTIDAAFGSDPGPARATPAGNPVTFETIAEAIRAMKPQDLPESSLADVLTMIEYLQKELVARYDAQVAERKRLIEMKADLELRELALALRQRAVSAVEAASAPPPAAKGLFKVLSRARG